MCDLYPAIHEDGLKAYSNGEPLSGNPYAERDERHNFWHEGWNDAQDGDRPNLWRREDGRWVIIGVYEMSPLSHQTFATDLEAVAAWRNDIMG